MPRACRRLVAIVTLLGLLAVQGSVAAHPCALKFEAPPGSVPVSPVRHVMADCAGMHDTAETALCVQHCGQGKDANTTLGTADVPAPALHRCLTVEPAPMPVTTSTLAATRPAARSTSPPPLLLSQRLRI
jgi:hypothetical protein